MPKVHIHEDDEGMRNVYPAATVGEVMDDLAAAKSSSEANLAPNGIGWTDVHAIREPEKSFRELEVDLQRVSNAIGSILPKIKEFEVGFGTNNPFHYKDEDAKCFGYGQTLYLKLEAEGDCLKAIWFDANSNVEEELSALRRALEAINDIQPSMIADYWLNTGGLVSDQAYLDCYFNDLRRSALPSTEPSNLGDKMISQTWWSRLVIRLFGTGSP